MNDHTTNNSTAGDVVPSVSPHGHKSPKMTLEEAQQKSDAELLKIISNAQGHTEKDFSDYMNCAFSYSSLTKILRERGYEKTWHKTSEGSSPMAQSPTVILMKQPKAKSTTRKSFIIDNDVAEDWKTFNVNVPFPSVTIGYALRRFMNDYNSGLIKFELEI